LRVLAVDVERGVAKVGGKEVFGVEEEYDAVIAELCPYKPTREIVDDRDVEARLGDRLPMKLDATGEPLRHKPPRLESAESEESIVERLAFGERCLSFYRRRFAKGATAEQAEDRLRAELRGAEMIRKRHTREYLRLRVPERFDVVLYRRPVQDDFQSCLVTGLQLPVSGRQRKAA
jgi:hypothetical protein